MEDIQVHNVLIVIPRPIQDRVGRTPHHGFRPCEDKGQLPHGLILDRQDARVQVRHRRPDHVDQFVAEQIQPRHHLAGEDIAVRCHRAQDVRGRQRHLVAQVRYPYPGFTPERVQCRGDLHHVRADDIHTSQDVRRCRRHNRLHGLDRLFAGRQTQGKRQPGRVRDTGEVDIDLRKEKIRTREQHAHIRLRLLHVPLHPEHAVHVAIGLPDGLNMFAPGPVDPDRAVVGVGQNGAAALQP